MKKYLPLIALALAACAEIPPPDDEPVAGSVAVIAQPITATISLNAVLRHFGLGTPVFQTLLSHNGQVFYQPTLDKQMYYRVGDTMVPIKFGYYQGTVDTGLDEICRMLSGRYLFTVTNGVYAPSLDLRDRMVMRQ